MTRVVVVGGGNAGLCAAIAAREAGADVCLLERAPEALRGGNSAFTAGLMRTVYDDVGDVLRLADSLTDEDLARTDFGSYTAGDFLNTLARITEYRCDPELASQLVRGSAETLEWLTSHGVRFAPAYGRQAFRQGDRFRFWGGAILEVVGGGRGLVDGLYAEAGRLGVEVRYETRALSLRYDERTGERGVRVSAAGAPADVPGDAVVLAAGGSRPTPSGGPGTWVRAGTWRRYAARATTPATASGWHCAPGHRRPGTGAGATRSPGTGTRPSSATCGWATASRSTATRSASSSTPAASASSTRVPTSATTPTRGTAARSSRSRVRPRGRSSTSRRPTCSATSTVSARCRR